MTLGQKLTKLRKENNYTQEQLAEILGVSRQSISKWESDSAYPETEKLLRLGRMYHCSMDYLLKDEIESPDAAPAASPAPVEVKVVYQRFSYERKSQKTLWGLPLWHINIGDNRVAKGIFALGNVSIGFVSAGLCSVGLLSAGLLSVGLLLSFGLLSIGSLALGATTVGLIAIGALAVGVFSLGACSIGSFSIGAAALGRYAALGEAASAAVVIGGTDAQGTLLQVHRPLTPAQITAIKATLAEITPPWLAPFRVLFQLFLR